ncbi:monalysin family beta-barrel pore-forming toxin [Pseudomonas xanthosomatis]|uniref:monalysin family beta-barrel pore-forming toxin n=1 Tax=Pseudomonas xanthosomatis TaxID=2842356 RepID=UPI001C3D10A0|nr:monalysin family beta-barrel pore-forming toxin [Pseudomonas xanthosomatis]QXH45922.1 monalysin family beta-barrel pore-forming toxin [Pseudomonas xanthosomatis]
MSSHEELKGSYEIERYLYGEQGVQAGSWVAGQTVIGDIKIDGVVVECFTRPVYAYLSYCARVQKQSSGPYVHSQHYQCGLNRDFLAGLGVPFKVRPGINRVNTLSRIVTDLPADILWGKPVEQARDVYLNDDKAYLVYQVNIAYAHCLVDGKPSNAKLGRVFSEVTGQWLLVSSVSTDRLVVVDESQAVEAPGWQAVRQAVLAAGKLGSLEFDQSVAAIPFNRYK